MSHFNKKVRFLKPKFFILGIFIGFILCSITGVIVSQSARFAHFNRFFRLTQPESHFYPTINELLSTIRHEVDPNKILILVGGSSLFRGVGQNPDELWTQELQKLLGNNFKVINFAANGAGASSFAGVVFRVLNEKYKRMIYVTDCPSHGGGKMDGFAPYTYLFWDAYYKKLLPTDNVENTLISQIRRNEIRNEKGLLELHLMNYLDSIFYFKDLWNWVSYRVVFTVWHDFAYMHPYRPRISFTEENLDLKAIKIKNEKARFQEEVDHIKNTIISLADLSKSHYKDETLVNVRNSYDEAFVPRYRSKILCVTIPDNPKHLSRISKKISQSSRNISQQTSDLLRSLNYNTINIGQDFVPADYFDGRHLSPSGGNKVAFQVANEVKTITIQNGYF